jgi:hypothetical protein
MFVLSSARRSTTAACRWTASRDSGVLGGPSNGEVCDACETLITDQLVMEGIADGSKRAIQMHLHCFALWDEERREPLN